MAHAKKSVLINRPVQSVFDFVVNGANNKLWQAAVLDVLPMGEAPFGVGSTFRQGRKGPGGREAADYELTEVRPNELIAFRVIAGPAKLRGVYRFETRGSTTLLTLQLEGDTETAQDRLDEDVASLDELKAFLEKHA